jgi:Fic family protein
MQLNCDISLNLFNNLINLVEINSKLKLLDISHKVSEEINIEDFIYFSKLLNLEIDTIDIKTYALGLHKIEDNFYNHITSGYRNSNEMIPSFDIYKNDIFSLNVISRINKVLTEKTVEVWESGKLRNADFPYNGEYDFLKEKQIVDDDKIHDSLYELFNFYKDDKYPKILKVFILTYNLFLLKPFCALNDLSVVVIMKLLLFDIDFFPNIPYLKIFYENKKDLDISVDINTWINNLSEILNKAFRDEYQYILKYISLEKRKFLSNKLISGLNQRQQNIFFFLLENKNISRLEYSRIYKISPMTAYRDLNDMKNKNILASFGNGRGLRYTILEKFLI